MVIEQVFFMNTKRGLRPSANLLTRIHTFSIRNVDGRLIWQTKSSANIVNKIEKIQTGVYIFTVESISYILKRMIII